MSWTRRSICALLVMGCAAVVWGRAKEFVAPRAFHANTYPAHDDHADEQFSIGADPYDMPDKAAEVFTVDYQREGLLPVYIVFSNDRSEPVTMVELRVKLITKKRARLEPLDSGDIYRRIAHLKSRPSDPSPTVGLPLPLPKKRSRSISEDAQAEVEAMQFLAKAVEPKTTKGGFFVFDVRDLENPLAGAQLEIDGLRGADGKELFYFSIPMEKYLGYKPGSRP